MPQILTSPWDILAITVSAVANTTYAVVARRGAHRLNVFPNTNAGKFSWDETDKAAVSANIQPIPADSLYSIAMPTQPFGELDRRAGILTFGANPAANEYTTIYDGTTTAIFEYTVGAPTIPTAVAVANGVSAADTALNLAAAITASALDLEADQGLKDTSQVHWMAKSQAVDVTVTDGTGGDVTSQDLGDDGVVFYIASAVGATVFNVSTEGRDS